MTEGTIQQLRKDNVFMVDWTMISNFVRCPERFNLRFEKGLLPTKTMENYGLNFGIGLHKSAEVWYSAKDDVQGLQAFLDTFTTEEPAKISNKTNKELSATYTRIFGCSLLTAYFNAYRKDGRPLVSNEQALSEEVEEGVYLCGRIDKIFKGPNGLVFMDHKSTKYMNDFRITPNGQFMGYKFLCEKLTGEKVTGELDIIGVSKSERDMHKLLRREPFDYTKHQMSEWKASLTAIIRQINYCRQENFWPQHWDCDPYFRPCMFADVCMATRKEAKEQIVSGFYTINRWDPFAVGL